MISGRFLWKISPDIVKTDADDAIVVEFYVYFQSVKKISAICHAGWMLASAGILKGRKATSFFAIKDDMKNAGALWEDKEVVVDKNLITSRTPDDLPVFMKSFLAALKKAA